MRAAILMLLVACNTRLDPPPTLTILRAPSDRVAASEVIALSFSSSATGRYAVRILGDRELLGALGEIQRDAPVDTTLPAALLQPGVNRVRIEVSSRSGLAIAHATFTVTRDAAIAPSLSLSQTHVVVSTGDPIDLTLTREGEIARVDVALPSFLSFDGTHITGTGEPLAETSFVFTATGVDGDLATATLTLRVKDVVHATLNAPPEPATNVLGTHDLEALTAPLVTDATSIECFADGAYAPCSAAVAPLSPSGRVAGEYVVDQPIRVRLGKPNADTIEREVSTAAFAGVYVYACTDNVLADESADVFAGRLVDDSVVCLDDVDITGTTPVAVAADSTIIVGLQATRARFTNTVSNTFEVGSESATIANIIVSGGAIGSAVYVDSSELHLSGVDLATERATGPDSVAGSIRLSNPNARLTLSRSRVVNTGNSESSAGIEVSDGLLDVRDSTVIATGSAVFFFQGTISGTSTIRDSILRSLESDEEPALFTRGLNRTLVVTDSVIEEDTYTGAVCFDTTMSISGGRITAPVGPLIVGSDASFGNLACTAFVSDTILETRSNGVFLWNGSLQMNRTQIIRVAGLDAQAGADYAVSIQNSGGVRADLSSASNGNAYCFESSDTPFVNVDRSGVMTPIFGTEGGTDLPFDFAAQANGGAAVPCP